VGKQFIEGGRAAPFVEGGGHSPFAREGGCRSWRPFTICRRREVPFVDRGGAVCQEGRCHLSRVGGGRSWREEAVRHLSKEGGAVCR
jgi:hypothetical protein